MLIQITSQDLRIVNESLSKKEEKYLKEFQDDIFIINDNGIFKKIESKHDQLTDTRADLYWFLLMLSRKFDIEIM